MNTQETTTAASVAVHDRPLGGINKKRKYKEFFVSNETFNKFQTGRAKFERWAKFLNLEDANHKTIVDFHKHTQGQGIIVLRNEDTGALRAVYTRDKR